jgi:hypothetical protein
MPKSVLLEVSNDIKMHSFIIFVFIVKILFVVLAAIHFYLMHTGKNMNNDFAKGVVYWKERLEFIFMISMAFLTVYIFRPYNSAPITIGTEARFLFFVFGIIVFITAHWSIFIQKAKWFSILQYVLGRNGALEESATK